LYYQKPQSTSYKEEYSEEELEYKDLKSKCLLRALSLANCKKETFLDIGAGEGFLMNIAAKDGFLVNGIDFSSYGINKFFPQLSDKLIEGDIYEVIKDMVSNGTKFTACAAINVLEHVIDPVLFLSTIKPIIQPEGLLAITVPNDFSDFQSLLINENFIDREFWFSPPQHLHYFNTKNIVTFCVANGYELVDAYSDFPIDYFLLHPGSNYIVDKSQGKAAHKARILHDLMIAKGGIDRYLNLYRAMFNVGIGRDITVILRIKKE
jgi:2-polyprenyl-3-methyl-5-hydroxy-6-metoxy-1,4-benzoquinol methylase